MKLQGRVYGYESTIAKFTLEDVTEGYHEKEDGLLYIRTDLGEIPIIYDSIQSDPDELATIEKLYFDCFRKARGIIGPRSAGGAQSPEVEN